MANQEEPRTTTLDNTNNPTSDSTSDNKPSSNGHGGGGTLKVMKAIVVVFVLVTVLLVIRLFTEKSAVTEYRVKVECIADSCADNRTRYIQGEFTDSVVARINRQEEELHRTYELFMKAREEDADIVKYLTLLGGLVVSACAILGVRSLKEFRDTVQTQIGEEAKQIAKKEAKPIATEIAKTEAKSQAKKISKEISKEISKKWAITTVKAEIDSVVKSEVKTRFQESIENDQYFKFLEERLTAELVKKISDKWEEKFERIEGKIDALKDVEDEPSGNEAANEDDVQSEAENGNEGINLTDIG